MCFDEVEMESGWEEGVGRKKVRRRVRLGIGVVDGGERRDVGRI